jgi:acetyl-CoA carboxylase biotin carboxylase subunit
VFQKILVANRGEIAVRVIRALREMKIPSVAVYSDADRASLHVRMADEAAHIGPSASAESYLSHGKLIDAARKHGADAIHPGYGFLSENAAFAAACKDAGLSFIGPDARVIAQMGSKIEARRLASEACVPIVPGSVEPVRDPDEALHCALKAGYPVMLKAAGGGGGKGMRRVDSPSMIESAFRDAASEAERAFGNGSLYIEKLIEKPRHVEIQVLADAYGGIVHLGERECSIQRRHQKVIEESPSPLTTVKPELRDEMGAAAVRLARAAGYLNAGTLEFLVDAQGQFYFLEMNTRLQVEHPVTELVTGLDLVQLQVRIAAGEKLPFVQQEIRLSGAAMECRIYAEDPDNDFFPSPGKIETLSWPAGPGVRVDAGVYAGWTVPLEYDPLLAKLAVWAPTREQTIARMFRAVHECHVGGVRTTLSFFRRVLGDEAFIRGDLHTGFIQEWSQRTSETLEASGDREIAAAIVAVLHSAPRHDAPQPRANSHWLSEGRSRLLR